MQINKIIDSLMDRLVDQQSSIITIDEINKLSDMTSPHTYGGGKHSAIYDNGTEDAEPYGGRGGNGAASFNGGGAGNPAGSSYASLAESGTGGLLILMVKGNITMGPNGKIESNGSAGGPDDPVNGDSGTGGGSGGGNILIIHAGTLSNTSGKINSNGGFRGISVFGSGRE